MEEKYLVVGGGVEEKRFRVADCWENGQVCLAMSGRLGRRGNTWLVREYVEEKRFRVAAVAGGMVRYAV